MASAVQLDGGVVVLDVGAREDPALADHAADAAHRVRAAAEPEQVDLVARLVIADEKAVGVVDVGFHPVAEGAAGQAVEEIAGADALIVVDHLQRRAIALRDAVGDLHDVGGRRNAVALLVGAVPRSIAAQDQPFHRRPSQRWLASPTSSRTSASVLPDDFSTWKEWSAPSSQCISHGARTVARAFCIMSGRLEPFSR